MLTCTGTYNTHLLPLPLFFFHKFRQTLFKLSDVKFQLLYFLAQIELAELQALHTSPHM
jgi:hypothetical protein